MAKHTSFCVRIAYFLVIIGLTVISANTNFNQDQSEPKRVATFDTEIRKDDDALDLNHHHRVEKMTKIIFKNEDLDTWNAPDEIRENYPYFHSGYDLENRPIWVEPVGRWNYRKMLEAGGETYQNFDKHVEQSFYRIVKSIHNDSLIIDGVRPSGAIVIVDLDKFNLFQVAHLPTLSYLLDMMRKYHPVMEDFMHVGILVNTNAVASMVLNLMRPILGSVMERMEIFGTERSRWVPKILKHCPKDSLPANYGGRLDFVPVASYG